MSRGFELSFGTIATLVGVFVVLIVVLVFFRGSFEDLGAKLGLVSQRAGSGAEAEAKAGGGLDIGGLVSGIRGGMCTINEDCPQGEGCTDTWMCSKAGCYADGYLAGTLNACKTLCNCGTGFVCKGPTKRCWPV